MTARTHACLIVFGLALTSLNHIRADELPTSPAQRYLKSGEFSRGEVALNLRLDSHPKDDEARFGLGVIQFLKAIEKVGRTLYEYGADGRNLSLPLPALPVPKNEHPATICYSELQRVLQVFIADLKTADETLAQVADPDVKLKLLLSEITFDFPSTGQQRVTMAEILTQLNGQRPLFPESNQAIRIHFDRGDVAWLRAYCHLLSSMAEASLTIKPRPESMRWFNQVFPKWENSPGTETKDQRVDSVVIEDATHLRRVRLHLVAVCELNRETWKYIRQEKDDDYEWLSNSAQKDQLGLPISDRQIDGWLNALTNLEELLKGESLVPSELFVGWVKDFPESKGLNLRKVFDDPPDDLLNGDRLRDQGIEAKYLESIDGKKKFDTGSILRLANLFGGPFGFARAARMN